MLFCSTFHLVLSSVIQVGPKLLFLKIIAIFASLISHRVTRPQCQRICYCEFLSISAVNYRSPAGDYSYQNHHSCLKKLWQKIMHVFLKGEFNSNVLFRGKKADKRVQLREAVLKVDSDEEVIKTPIEDHP